MATQARPAAGGAQWRVTCSGGPAAAEPRAGHCPGNSEPLSGPGPHSAALHPSPPDLTPSPACQEGLLGQPDP